MRAQDDLILPRALLERSKLPSSLHWCSDGPVYPPIVLAAPRGTPPIFINDSEEKRTPLLQSRRYCVRCNVLI